MKNELYYYYGLEDIQVHHKNKKYYIYKKKNKYILKPCYRKYEELMEIFTLIEYQNNYKFHKIILNRNNSIITIINNVPYILLKLEIKDDRFIDFNDILKINNSRINLNNLKLKNIYRTNWVDLWSNKIDYFEYQLQHIRDKYKNISLSINFYIGLSENAISYINQVLSLSRNINISIGHRRLHYETTLIDFYDPTTIIIDYKARDISEYLKSLFLMKELDYIYIENFLRKLSWQKEDYELLFGRLLFPSFYFDIYEDIINNKKQEKDILKIISRSEEYIKFLKKIFLIIYRIQPIKKVDWITSTKIEQ